MSRWSRSEEDAPRAPEGPEAGPDQATALLQAAPTRPGPLWRWARVIALGIVAGFGGALLILLPELPGAIPVEIFWFFQNPFLRITALVVLLVLGPERIIRLVPQPSRDRLAARMRRALQRRPATDALVLAKGAARAVAAPLPGRLSRLDGYAARVLSGPITVVLAAACAVFLLTWVPHYLTWPWWPDADQFAVSAQFWEAGIVPFRDLLDFDFPGPIYVHYLLGKAFGWGGVVPFNAFDATTVIVLGIALAAWSRRRFGSALPGLVSYTVFLCQYLSWDYAWIAQRDWHAPCCVLLGLFALEAWPGRAGRLASALAMALALSYRPHEIVFLPAMAAAVDEGGRRAEEPWRRAVLPLGEWAAFLALALVLAFSPLILAGALDDFVRSLEVNRHGPYNHCNWASFKQGVSSNLRDPITSRLLGVNLLLAVAGPTALRRTARTWSLALLGVMFYKPMSPFPHAYLDQPTFLLRAIGLAPPLAWLLSTCRLSASWRLAAVATALVALLPHAPPVYSRFGLSFRALGPLVRGTIPLDAPPGCSQFLSTRPYPNDSYRWDDYRRVLNYLRESTPAGTRVADLLWKFPYPPVNGPSGRLTPFPAGGGYIHMITIDHGLVDEYAAILERDRDVLAVWTPVEPNPEFPELDEVLRRTYRPVVRFGKIEIWRHKQSTEPNPPATAGPPGTGSGRSAMLFAAPRQRRNDRRG